MPCWLFYLWCCCCFCLLIQLSLLIRTLLSTNPCEIIGIGAENGRSSWNVGRGQRLKCPLFFLHRKSMEKRVHHECNAIYFCIAFVFNSRFRFPSWFAACVCVCVRLFLWVAFVESFCSLSLLLILLWLRWCTTWHYAKCNLAIFFRRNDVAMTVFKSNGTPQRPILYNNSEFLLLMLMRDIFY